MSAKKVFIERIFLFSTSVITPQHNTGVGTEAPVQQHWFCPSSRSQIIKFWWKEIFLPLKFQALKWGWFRRERPGSKRQDPLVRVQVCFHQDSKHRLDKWKTVDKEGHGRALHASVPLPEQPFKQEKQEVMRIITEVGMQENAQPHPLLLS